MPLVALLTDFGDSGYAGVLRGVVHTHCPGATVVDLTHQVPPQAVRQGAWLLLQSFRYFPAGTVFCCVVDPGVGSERRALAAMAGAYSFVGPDNGLCYPALRAAATPARPLRAFALATPAGASATFHGRDLFAPVAARLAAGGGPAIEGPPIEPVPLHFHRRGRLGEVVHVDRFGNGITNLPPVPGRQRYRARLWPPGGKPVWSGGLPLFPNYAAAPAGEPCLVIGSAGTLEIAWQSGSAADHLPLSAGLHVRLD